MSFEVLLGVEELWCGGTRAREVLGKLLPAPQKILGYEEARIAVSWRTFCPPSLLGIFSMRRFLRSFWDGMMLWFKLNGRPGLFGHAERLIRCLIGVSSKRDIYPMKIPCPEVCGGLDLE